MNSSPTVAPVPTLLDDPDDAILTAALVNRGRPVVAFGSRPDRIRALLDRVDSEPNLLVLHATREAVRRVLPATLEPELLVLLRVAVHGRYRTVDLAGDYTPVADLTRAARHAAGSARTRGGGNPAPWPWSNAASPLPRPLPQSMPDGRPWPLISIVTPSLNQGRFLEECLLSVASQGYPAVEHIVMDGGSTDETGSVLERWHDRLTHVESRPDGGQSHAINKGMALTTGSILTWLNADDQLAPDALMGMALAFATTSADMVAGICEFWRDGVLERSHLTACPDGLLPLADLLDLEGSWFSGRFFYQPEVFFSRDLWNRAGACVDESLHYSMDWELWTRFARAKAQIAVIGRPVARFRAHPDQKTHDPLGYRGELIALRDRIRAAEPSALPVRATAPSDLRLSLRIVMLNDVGFADGAGIAHGRLAAALAAAGHDVYPVALVEKPIDPAGDWPIGHQAIINELARLQPDLIIVGNLHAARPNPVLPALLAERWPTLIILHDFWMLTGRCPYPQLCGGDRFITGCDADCPDPDSNPPLQPERIAAAWVAKRIVTTDTPGLALLAPSDWAVIQARRAFPTEAGDRVGRVVLGFPLDQLRPADRATCRDILGLPRDRFIVFLTTTDLAETRKGADELFIALRDLRLPDLLVMTVGRGSAPEQFAGIPVRHFGYVSDLSRMACLFAAADLLVGPSSAETLGQIYLESTACGTPSIGYDGSGVVESICNGVSGLTVMQGETFELAAAIEELHADPALRHQLAFWGRVHVENVFSMAACYRSLHLALDRLGWSERLRLAPNIRLLAQPPALRPMHHILPLYTAWQPREGFGFEEGPFPDLGLPVLRWAHGPGASMDVFVAADGPYLLQLFCHNIMAGQQVTLGMHGVELQTFHLPLHDIRQQQTLSTRLSLAAGGNQLTLSFSAWQPHLHNNALIIVGVQALAI
jgi:glycosyltransferase involved in cell wall biosynthesis